MIPKDIFFDTLTVPNFLLPYFEMGDWYLLPNKLQNICEHNIPLQIWDDLLGPNVSGRVYIWAGSKVHPTAVIEGPCWIGDNVKIGPHAYIRPGSIICDEASIGHAAEVKDSLIFPKAKIANHTFLGNSILGSRGRMGGQSETGNRRFDQEKITISFEDQKLPTNTDFYGAIIGGGSRLGGGVKTSPGTLIGKNTFIATWAILAGYIPQNKFVKVRTQMEVVDNGFSGILRE